jgi:HSP20 family molecular chaperone IbpA
MNRPTTHGENIQMNLVQALDRIYADAFPIASYPIPRSSQGNVDFTYDTKTSTYVATIDAAGANKAKFNVKIVDSTLNVSYAHTEGYRCRSFAYSFPLGRGANVTSSTASYVDGILTVTLNTATQTQNSTTIPVN